VTDTNNKHTTATYKKLANNSYIQQVAREWCDKRSHGWRSARLGAGCSMEGKAHSRATTCAYPVTRHSEYL